MCTERTKAGLQVFILKGEGRLCMVLTWPHTRTAALGEPCGRCGEATLATGTRASQRRCSQVLHSRKVTDTSGRSHAPIASPVLVSPPGCGGTATEKPNHTESCVRAPPRPALTLSGGAPSSGSQFQPGTGSDHKHFSHWSSEFT